MFDISKVFQAGADNMDNTERLFYMAKILEGKRRLIKMSVDDVLNIVRMYQQVTRVSCCYEHTRELLAKQAFYLPEDL